MSKALHLMAVFLFTVICFPSVSAETGNPNSADPPDYECSVSETMAVAGLTVTATSTDAICDEDNGTAMAFASVTGGTGALTYVWSNSESTALISDLAPGNYSVTVTGANGASGSTTVTVGLSILTVDVTTSSTDAECGDPTGTATVSGSVSGSSAGITYLWSNGATTATIADVPGSYTVTATDANGCTGTGSATIGSTPAVGVSATSTNSICTADNGTATASVSGGTGIISYDWSNSDMGASISGLAPGSYDVTVTDDNGCTDVTTVSVGSSNPSLSVSTSTTDETCTAGDGTATASAAGGTGTITYDWDNGDMDATSLNLSAGTYDVTATDDNGCEGFGSATVNQNVITLSVTISGTDASCGDSNGSAAASVSGATGTITYSWDNGGNTASINGLAAGIYILNVSDDNGCTGEAMVTIGDTPAVAVSVTAVDASCGMNNGSVTASVSGGTAGFSYIWSNGSFDFSGGATSSITNLTSGNYGVTVTDANLCTATETTTVGGSPAVTVSASTTSTTCGSNNGTASASASGGTAGFTYLWSNGDMGANISNLSAGSYTVVATDANNCTASTTVTVGGSSAISVSVTGMDDSCEDGIGSASASVSGSTGMVTYSWSNGGSGSSISNLTAGTYTVNVSDGNGCTASGSVTIGTTPAVAVSVTAVDASCGMNNGSVTASVSGGTAGFSYIWSNGSFDFSGGATSSITNLTSGNYGVTVTDANLCTATETTTVGGSPAVTVSASATSTTCGSNNGTASASASGGTAGFTYAWSNGDMGANISNLSAGSYTVVVTDANNCTASTTVTVGGSSAISVSVTGMDDSCETGVGSASASVSGATGMVTYSWTGGGSGSSISGLTAGTYTVNVSDGNGCLASGSVTIGTTPAVMVSATATDETCDSGNGTATASVTGGTSAFSYAWSNGGSTEMISSLTGGTYDVTVTDMNGCTDVASATVGSTPAVSVSATATSTTCGLDNGTASASVSGGTSAFSYAWTGGGTNASISGLSAGNYTVVVTDANGCTATTTVTVGDSDPISVSVTGSDDSCETGIGSASASVSGSTGTVTYAWSNGGSGSSISGLTAGTYTVNIVDGNGCTASGSVTIGTTPAVMVSATATDETCDSGNGTATASVTGGTSAFSYAWSNGGSAATISGLTGGTYDVTVTDMNGCTDVASATVGSTPAVSVSATATSTTCGLNNGTASASVSGGTSAFSYAWTGGGTNASISGLSAGNYTVVVTDANGCTATTTVTVGDSDPISVSVTGSDDSCETGVGSASASVSGATGTVTYTWSNGGSGSSISGLTAGTYTVNVSDGNGCLASGSVTIGTTPAVMVSATATDETCDSGNGTATASVTGGTSAFSYVWSNGGSTAMISGLTGGTYDVTVTDMNGCTDVASATVGSTPAVSVSATAVDASCDLSNGSASASVSGGTAGFTYSWSNGGTGSMITNVPGGSYTVNVTDANGCTASASVTVGTTPAVSVSATAVDASCDLSNGSASASVSGGTAGFTYSWSNGGTGSMITNVPGGTYTVNVTDANGCTASASVTVGTTPAVSVSATAVDASCELNNGSASASVSGGTAGFTYSWSNGGTGSMITNVPGGTYTVNVTDANGCMASASVTVGTTPAVSVSATVVDASCDLSNGSASASVSGGTAGFSYSWSNGGTGSTITGVPGGTYTVNVTDANGCMASASVTVGTTPAVIVSATVVDASCDLSNGSASASVSGGTAGFSYSWSNGGTGSTITGVPGGTYTVNVTDANGCMASASVTVGTTPAVIVSATAVDASCDLNNGSASASVSGGTAGFSYSWSNGGTGSTITGVPGGTYTVNVTDANGCMASASVTVGTTPAVIVSATAVDASCDLSNGSASASVSGGTAGFSYSWSNGGTGSMITNVPGGTYTVNVTDANGCMASASVTVGTTPAVSLSATAVDASCDLNNGSASASVSGGTAGFSYSWSNGGTGSTITGVPGGTYTVNVTDANGCMASASVTIGTTSAVTVSATAVDASCGLDNGTATASVSGGTAAFSYAWSNGDTGATISDLSAGTYDVTVTDANGCTASASVTINTTPGVSGTINSTGVSCYGANDGTATATVSTGTAPFTYAWSNSGTTAMISGLSAGTYDVTVTDANGCSATGTIPVNGPDNDTSDEWIESIDFSDLWNTSGDDGGYGDYCSMTANVITGDSYTMTMTPGYSGSAYREYWRVYIDYNQDGVFSGSELALQRNGYYTRTGTIHIPQYAMTGTTKMRVIMRYGGYASSCSSGFYGEVEDYTINITGCNNVTDGGTIEADETLCPGMDDPTAMTNVVSPSGGTGALEYVWLMNTSTSNPPPAAGWTTISNSDAPTYDPGVISQTTWYIRCARRAGCSEYLGESNVIEKTFNSNCNGPSYCNSKGLNTNYEWIKRVKLNNVTNVSGDDGGYGDYTNLVVNMNPGQSKKLTLTPGFSGSSYREYWRVWVDWNQDGDFDDAGELEGQGNGYGTVTGSVSVPYNAPSGQTRMRVSMRYGWYAGSCQTFAEGEVEDYTINVSGGGGNRVVTVGEDELAVAHSVITPETGSVIETTDFSERATRSTEIEVNVYPNPAVDELQVNYQIPAEGEAVLSIFDLTGKVVHQQDISNDDAAAQRTTLRVDQFAKGAYYLKVTSGSDSKTIKFFKM